MSILDNRVQLVCRKNRINIQNDDELIIELVRENQTRVDNRLYSLKLSKCFIVRKESNILMRFILQNTSSEKASFLFGTEFNWSVEDGEFLRGKRLKRIKTLKRQTTKILLQ